MFRLGYNTNGLAHHRPLDALALLADLGYEAVALTPDVGVLDPLRLNPREVADFRVAAGDLGLDLAVETGARFVLDPRRKHRPTLLEDSATERAVRVDFLRRSVDLAVELGAGVVSLWAGAGPEGTDGGTDGGTSGSAGPMDTLDRDPSHALGERLAEGLAQVLDHARGSGVRVGFEPEPGMFVERPVGFGTLLGLMGSAGDDLGLTLDVGHCVVTGDEPVGDVVRAWSERLLHVHLDDCPRGVHRHLPFGEGDLDLSEALSSLVTSGFRGMAAVELSRDAHRGVDAAAEAYAAVRGAL